MKKYNIVVAIVSILLGAIILGLSSSLTGFDETGVPGEAFWPQCIAWLFIGLGGLQALELVLLPKLNADREVDLHSHPMRIAYVGAAMAVAYAVVMTFTGFVVGSILFIPAMMLLMGERRPLALGSVTVGVIGVVWVFFVQVFNSTLPTSMFFD